MKGTPNSDKKLVVIGGGAAGFFCAINAARLNPSLHVTIIEKSGKLLSKVKVSGGGRCNVTHDCTSAIEMAKNYPRGEKFMRKTLHAFGPEDTVSWFADRGVILKTESDGRMFPVTDRSQTIIDCLMLEAQRYQVSIRVHCIVESLSKEGNQWVVKSASGENILADYVCIATGGFPKVEQFSWIKALGHTIEDPVPSLFTFNLPGHSITGLKGISVSDAIIRIPSTGHQASGPLLITHWGLSGPAVLRLSAWAARALAQKNWHFELIVHWLPAFHEQQFLTALKEVRSANPRQQIGHKNAWGLPSRLWEYLLETAGMNSRQDWGNTSDRQLNALMNYCCHSTFQVSGKTTFKEEFVTAGGVHTSEIDAHSMQSKCCRGLFFAGEIMDVDGITGGFNFQHAWTSGWLAARAIAGISLGNSEKDTPPETS